MWEQFFFPSLAVPLLHILIPGGIIDSHLFVVSILCVLMLFRCLLQLVLSPSSRNLKVVGRTATNFMLTIPCFNVIAIIFGAHPLSQFWGTFSWSVLVSLLLLLPSLSLLEASDMNHWSTLLLQGPRHSKEQAVIIICITTLLGAWCGAFPILLDWNRPWQVWPIPSCIGALVGNAAGGLLGALLVLQTERTTTGRKSA